MKILLPVLVCFILFIDTGRVTAQTVPAQYASLPESDMLLPPLNDLIDSAIKHNPAIKFRKNDIDAKGCNVRSQQKYWTRNLGVQADSRYGTFDNYSSNANGQSSSFITTTSRQLNYGAGIYLKFPLVDVLDRKNQVRQAKIELEQARNMEENQENEVRQLVIQQYQDVLLKQRLLQIRARALGDSRVNGDMVEKQFRSGIIQVAEYVRISDIVSRVESDYETAKTAFITSKMILENIVGFTFPVYSITKNENN